MDRILRTVVGGAAVVFVLLGAGWWVAPSLVGGFFEMALLDGRGLSTQLADLASFFLTLGGCILAGLITGNRLWFYPAVSLLGVAAFGRVLAWLAHGASLTLDNIAVEVVVAAALVALIRLPSRSAPESEISS